METKPKEVSVGDTIVQVRFSSVRRDAKTEAQALVLIGRLLQLNNSFSSSQLRLWMEPLSASATLGTVRHTWSDFLRTVTGLMNTVARLRMLTFSSGASLRITAPSMMLDGDETDLVNCLVAEMFSYCLLRVADTADALAATPDVVQELPFKDSLTE